MRFLKILNLVDHFNFIISPIKKNFICLRRRKIIEGSYTLIISKKVYQRYCWWKIIRLGCKNRSLTVCFWILHKVLQLFTFKLCNFWWILFLYISCFHYIAFIYNLLNHNGGFLLKMKSIHWSVRIFLICK